MARARRLIAVLCILAVVAGALLAPVGGAASAAVLVPLPLLFGLIVLPAVAAGDTTPAYSFVPSGPQPSRAPPAV